MSSSGQGQTQPTSEDIVKFPPIVAILLAVIAPCLPACNARPEQPHPKARQVTAINPESKSVSLVQQYPCQIRAHHHVQLRAPEVGYLDAIPIEEGQHVKAGDLLFKIIPIHDRKKADAPLNYATVRAPFGGIVDRLQYHEGSLVQQGETLSTLSDNSAMWVYFNVPEVRYLEYMADPNQLKQDLQIELVLADGQAFDQVGKLGAIEADFDSRTGNIPFRADFPNPDGLLRHGQSGTVALRRVQHDAIVVPQRATFEILTNRYVYVIDDENVARQREIVVENELDDLFVVKQGVGVDDKIVLDGVRQIRDGDRVEYEDRQAGQVAAHLKK